MSPVFFYRLQGGCEGNFKRGIIYIASQGGGLETELSFWVLCLKKKKSILWSHFVLNKLCCIPGDEFHIGF